MMPRLVHDYFEKLAILVTTGELSAEETARLARHLRGCVDCRCALEDSRVITIQIAFLPLESSNGLDDRDEGTPDECRIETSKLKRRIADNFDAVWRMRITNKSEATPGLAGVTIGSTQGSEV